MALHLSLDVPGTVREFDKIRRKQVPFATSLAVNDVAASVRRVQIAGIFERFTIRRPARIKNSIGLRRSSKQTLAATLTIRDAFLVQHESGGSRRPGDIYPSMVQPIAAREKKIGVIRGRNTPAAVLKRGRNAFTGKTSRGNVGIFRTVGRGKRAMVELVFVLNREVTLRPRLKFADTALQVSRLEWNRAFDTAMTKALATAK